MTQAARSAHNWKTNAVSAGGFTLVELLVVVGVIATLMGLLLPALSGARAQGWAVVGASNIRQLQLANELYANTHDGRYMPAAAQIHTRNLHRWHGTRTHTREAFRPQGAPITSFLDTGSVSAAVRACPAFVRTLDDLRAREIGFELGCGGYGYNAAFVGVVRRRARTGSWSLQRDDIGSRRSRFRQPMGTIGFTDAALAGDELVEYSFAEPIYWPNWPGAHPDPSIHFRHAGRANVAWLDGHVSRERRTLTWSSGIYQADPDELNIGWFTPTDSNDAFDYE